MSTDNATLRSRYKELRKKVLSLTPFIRRSRHERALWRIDKYLQLERRAHEALGYLFFSPPPLASMARCTLQIPLSMTPTDELCLFVTHAPAPELKPHVIDHVRALLAANVAVILIVNTDLDPAAIQIPSELALELRGCMIRENVGYDFAAWAHMFSLIADSLPRARLYLVNDSIVGPLDISAYHGLLKSVRESSADLVGLTCNPDPHDHLQSFFLVFRDRLLHSDVFHSFMSAVVSMPRKESVVATYELWLTPFLQQHGFSVQALFPNISTHGPTTRNDTLSQWKHLVQLGFPFIKSAVLTSSKDADEARKFLPARYQ